MEYGSFDQNGIWHFDKAQIARELKIGIEENRVCPVLDPQMIMATLDRIPDAVDPNSDSHWEYTTNYEETDDGDFREVPTGVRPVLKAAASYIAGDYKPEWESPEQVNSGFGFRFQMPLPEEPERRRPTRLNVSLACAAVLVGMLLLL